VVTLAAARTDEQIQHDVLAELKWYARIQPNEIGVAVKDGIVTLASASKSRCRMAGLRSWVKSTGCTRSTTPSVWCDACQA
jgi:osmotically-inducible protein OsmY